MRSGGSGGTSLRGGDGRPAPSLIPRCDRENPDQQGWQSDQDGEQQCPKPPGDLTCLKDEFAGEFSHVCNSSKRLREGGT